MANLANTKWHKNAEKLLKPRQVGTHLRVLSETFPMNTNMTEFIKSLGHWALDESNHSIGRVKELFDQKLYFINQEAFFL